MYVLLMHCRAEFIKHVLPRLFNPVAPRSVGTKAEYRYDVLSIFILRPQIRLKIKKYHVLSYSECFSQLKMSSADEHKLLSITSKLTSKILNF